MSTLMKIAASAVSFDLCLLSLQCSSHQVSGALVSSSCSANSNQTVGLWHYSELLSSIDYLCAGFCDRSEAWFLLSFNGTSHCYSGL